MKTGKTGKRGKRSLKRKLKESMFLVLNYVCECVQDRDLTPGNVVVFVCDSRPLTQSRPTLQNLPTVHFWKIKLCFVFPQIRPFRVWACYAFAV